MTVFVVFLLILAKLNHNFFSHIPFKKQNVQTMENSSISVISVAFGYECMTLK